MDIILNIAMCQANTKASLSMKIKDWFGNPKVKADCGDLLNDDQIRIFNTLEKSISFVL